MNKDESFYKDIIDSIPESICVFDLKGNIVFYNTSFYNAYIKNNKSYKCKTFFDISNEEYQIVSLIQKTLKVGKPLSKDIEFDPHRRIAVSTVYSTSLSGETFIIEAIKRLTKALPQPSVKEPSANIKQSLILCDEKMKPIIETIDRISQFDSTILIMGESGTGKSVLARYIHDHSKRSHQPFITINCATIPEALIESELFGYVSGAFTGASKKGKLGKIDLADKGTLFLDEIGLLPMKLQTKFLQLIQEKTYTMVGAVNSKNVDIRIISATNTDLKEQILNQKFREDLYYRLRVIDFNIPPLRERPDAIEPLINFFIQQFNTKYNIQKIISEKAKATLKNYIWSGNIRELQYVLERLIVTTPENQITSNDLPPIYNSIPELSDTTPVNNVNFTDEVEHFEYNLLTKTFAKQKSSYKVATALNISQSKASRLLRKYDIN